jgi:hypothetical protein
MTAFKALSITERPQKTPLSMIFDVEEPSLVITDTLLP